MPVRGRCLQKNGTLDSGALLDCGGWACLLWETPQIGVDPSKYCLFVCCVVELRRNGRRVSVTGLNRIHRHTSTGISEFYGEQAQKPMCGSALVLARRGSVAGETVKSVRTHAFPMSVRTYAG